LERHDFDYEGEALVPQAKYTSIDSESLKLRDHEFGKLDDVLYHTNLGTACNRNQYNNLHR
jgi:hypothetical protein